ncbi:M24 family metallopeptidase [Chlorobium phaeobacteroides]|uniref:Peptidase M24 n=1 Tax=Chlorobium phaeobacteroides (strain DSM 266 / SMG 266 / 2430) TaxID=290317 RepID=A1BE14_CHLPD|nr:aminopeptidase P family protein [Chlorobium phaeobacteroides]ABL64641.1 peptidase M24 [Chlorobium phaeobacteroides DSM 266]
MQPDYFRPYRQAAIESILLKISLQALDSCIVTDLSVIRWLTGFSGSSARLLITQARTFLFTDFRYREQALCEVDLAEIIIPPDGFIDALASGNYPMGMVAGLQSDDITWHEASRLIDALSGKVKIVPVGSFFDEFRMIKNGIEIMKMQQAAAISEQVLDKIISMISPAVTELDLAAEITYQHKKLGADKDSFDPIVAGGPRSAMPHARPANLHFVPGEFIVLDIGCVYEGFASDQTRTVALGTVSREAKKVYHIVQTAQALGIRSAAIGMKACELDGLIRRYIDDHGYGEAFGHGLGHGVGLDVHEEPRISPKGRHELQENMVFTIEPGIYLPGKFGVRIEDTVLMTPDGAKPMQRFTKELIEL